MSLAVLISVYLYSNLWISKFRWLSVILSLSSYLACWYKFLWFWYNYHYIQGNYKMSKHQVFHLASLFEFDLFMLYSKHKSWTLCFYLCYQLLKKLHLSWHQLSPHFMLLEIILHYSRKYFILVWFFQILSNCLHDIYFFHDYLIQPNLLMYT